jgi:hypothetical protein
LNKGVAIACKFLTSNTTPCKEAIGLLTNSH